MMQVFLLIFLLIVRARARAALHAACCACCMFQFTEGINSLVGGTYDIRANT